MAAGIAAPLEPVPGRRLLQIICVPSFQYHLRGLAIRAQDGIVAKISAGRTLMTTSTLLFWVAVRVIISAGSSYAERQRERMKRGREILNRFSPEGSKKPLGL
jgi:hypothetical protein